MTNENFEPAPKLPQLTEQQRIDKANDFYEHIRRRRTIRDFSTEEISREVIEKCVLAAGTAPNGANLQPWHFSVVFDANIKKEIRELAEKEEAKFYQERAPQSWLDALKHLGTDENKPFLESAPCLIVVFAEINRPASDGSFEKNYYVSESVGIATGFLINALHSCGLATLTHTPSPMKFLNSILGRPSNERPYLVLVTGLPVEDATVPKLTKRPLNEIATFY